MFKTLHTFDNPFEAHLLKGRLESEGIPAFIIDENLVSLNPLYNQLAGGIKLKVAENDYAMALLISESISRQPHTDINNQSVACPQCKSNDIYANFKVMRGFKGVLSLIFSLLFFIFPLHFERVYHCKKCRISFKHT